MQLRYVFVPSSSLSARALAVYIMVLWAYQTASGTMQRFTAPPFASLRA
jgi:hypothetical protein